VAGDVHKVKDSLDLVVVTDAGRGAYLLRRACTPLRIEAYPARVTDPTGAGESFAGALAARVAVGDEPASAAGAAARVASAAVAGWGPEALFASARPEEHAGWGQNARRLA
jgi:ribokinase